LGSSGKRISPQNKKNGVRKTQAPDDEAVTVNGDWSKRVKGTRGGGGRVGIARIQKSPGTVLLRK